MNAWKLLADATIRAMARQAIVKGIDLEPAATAEAIKAELKSRIPTILQEWEDATAAHLSESWLRELMNAQANEAALAAFNRL